MDKFSLIPAHAFTNQPQLDLGDLLVSLAPGDLKGNCRVWFACTGSDANDDAVRLARQYFVEIGKPSKYQVIGRWRVFTGTPSRPPACQGLPVDAVSFSQCMLIPHTFLPPSVTGAVLNKPILPVASCVLVLLKVSSVKRTLKLWQHSLQNR
jgi:adenosylmethionine-8-amino-7-oxononanoate aminotransferase